MLEKLKKNKTSLAALIVLCAFLLLYWLITREDQDLGSLSSDTAGQEIIGQELLDELERLKSLNQVDVNFFNDPIWESLKNTTVQVVPQPVGRSNPFVRP